MENKFTLFVEFFKNQLFLKIFNILYKKNYLSGNALKDWAAVKIAFVFITEADIEVSVGF